MTTTKPKVHVVAGPTASGKTQFALELAKQVNGELINADSRQIYRYLDIGVNKGQISEVPTYAKATAGRRGPGSRDGQMSDVRSQKWKLEGVPIHLVNLLNPDERFSAYDYQRMAFEAIADVLSRGKVPIVVGGTGLYIDALINSERYLFLGQGAGGDNKTKNVKYKSRDYLNTLQVHELQEALGELAPVVLDSMNNSDRNNPRRLIRAIERLTTDPAEMPDPVEFPEYAWQMHYLTLPMAELTARINQRVIEMFADDLVGETYRVLQEGFPRDSIALQGIGYREVLRLLDGEIDGEECIRLVQIAHRQYAKRQLSWFGKRLAGESDIG